MAASGQCALRPLGLGTIHSRVPPITVSCGPTWASFVPNETRYAVTPAMATYRGRRRDTSSASRAPPACSSARLSSAAWAVARATRFVMPSPYPASSCCSLGASRRGVKPEPCSAGQNRLPGRAKCQPVAAEYRPGLIPQNSTRNGSPGAGSTSGTVRWRAAARSRPR